MEDFFNKLGNSLIRVGETAGVNWANTIGNASPAMATTEADDEGTVKIGGVELSTTALILTVGGVVGGLVLLAVLLK